MAKRTKKTYKELAIEFKKTRSEKVYNELYAKMRPGLWSYTNNICLLYTSPSPRDRTRSRMPSSA